MNACRFTRVVRTDCTNCCRSCGRFGLVAACLLALVGGSTNAAEVSTNGSGGGSWSDPATWRGNVIPGPADDVVVRKFDTVVFDRADDGKMTCRKLLIDPRGVLLMKAGSGSRTLTVAEGIETHGVIKLDGTRTGADSLELRLAGTTAAKRLIKIGRGGGLLLYGRAGLAGGKRNVALTAAPVPDAKTEVLALVEADGGAMIDWQRAHVGGVKLHAKKLDNTGAKTGERINLIECVFDGGARAYLVGCDTPIARNNTFHNGGPKLDEYALNAYGSPLAELRGNVVRGGYLAGLGVNATTDAVVSDNVVEKCAVGLQAGYGNPNVMIKNLTIRGCESGVKLEGCPGGILEGVTVEGALTGLIAENVSLQLTDFRVKDLRPKGSAIVWISGELKLLGGNVGPAHIKFTPAATLPAGQTPTPISALQHLVVHVKGAPSGTLVSVRTNDPKLLAAALDPNVRNSPAPLLEGTTPPPTQLTALLVKVWALDLKGKPLPTPNYVVKVLGPPPKEGAERPVRAMIAYRPPEPTVQSADKALTLEVPSK